MIKCMLAYRILETKVNLGGGPTLIYTLIRGSGIHGVMDAKMPSTTGKVVLEGNLSGGLIGNIQAQVITLYLEQVGEKKPFDPNELVEKLATATKELKSKGLEWV